MIDIDQPLTGAVRMPDLPELVAALWSASGEFTEQTLLRSGETVARFASRLTAQGVTDVTHITAEHCDGFIHARGRGGLVPELSTMHARRTALRMMFRILRDAGYPVGDPTLDIYLPSRTSRAARPLSDGEITLGRVASRLGNAGGSSLSRAVAWALGETTAVTSEMTAVRVNDLDDLANPRWIHLKGSARHDERLGELTDWGGTIVARQVALLRERGHPASTLLLYRGRGEPGRHVAQASACNTIADVLQAAGLNTEPDIRPGSLRNWAGRHLYDEGLPLEQVARRMGCRSLDTTAEDIALTWRSL